MVFNLELNVFLGSRYLIRFCMHPISTLEPGKYPRLVTVNTAVNGFRGRYAAEGKDNDQDGLKAQTNATTEAMEPTISNSRIDNLRSSFFGGDDCIGRFCWFTS